MTENERSERGAKWKRVREGLTHAGGAIDVQLEAGPAGAAERAPSVDANVLAGRARTAALVHIWGSQHAITEMKGSSSFQKLLSAQ